MEVDPLDDHVWAVVVSYVVSCFFHVLLVFDFFLYENKGCFLAVLRCFFDFLVAVNVNNLRDYIPRLHLQEQPKNTQGLPKDTHTCETKQTPLKTMTTQNNLPTTHPNQRCLAAVTSFKSTHQQQTYKQTYKQTI